MSNVTNIKKTNPKIFLFIAVAIAILVSNTLFIVTQVEQALVIEFGDIKRVVKTPGLKAKVPFLQNVIYFDNRLLEFHAAPAEFITQDKKSGVEERVVIDAFVRYKITNPVAFYQAVRNEANLNNRMNSIVVSNMRKVLAKHSLSELLSDTRTKIMTEIKGVVNAQTSQASRKEAGNLNAAEAGFGIDVVDVRIMRTDLPDDISQATFERMSKNFTKEAQKFRAGGEEISLTIRSSADREKVEIMAQAQKQSETIRGEGDAKAAKIYADAFNQDPQFFEFYRTMQAYKKTIKKEDTTVILSPNNKFLNMMD